MDAFKASVKLQMLSIIFLGNIFSLHASWFDCCISDSSINSQAGENRIQVNVVETINNPNEEICDENKGYFQVTSTIPEDIDPVEISIRYYHNGPTEIFQHQKSVMQCNNEKYIEYDSAGFIRVTYKDGTIKNLSPLREYATTSAYILRREQIDNKRIIGDIRDGFLELSRELVDEK